LVRRHCSGARRKTQCHRGRLAGRRRSEEDFLVVLRTAQIVFVGVLSVLLIVSARLESTIPVDGSLLIIAMLMLSPMTSHSHYVALMLPYTIIVAYWLRDRRTKLLGAAVMAISFLLATVTSGDLRGKAITDWTSRTSQIEAGAPMLIVSLAAILWNSRRPRAEPVHIDMP
jgi:hypothetical protein